MTKIKDRIVLGAVSGLLAGIPDVMLNALEQRLGLTDLTYGQMGANLFFPRAKINNREAQVAGYLANATLTAVSGVMFTYLLSVTGRDRAFIKGIGYGMASWAFVYGLGSKVGLQVQAKNKQAPLLSVIDHIIFGSILGLVTPNLGHDTLFPDCKTGSTDAK